MVEAAPSDVFPPPTPEAVDEAVVVWPALVELPEVVFTAPFVVLPADVF